MMVPSATDAWRNALEDLRESLPERTVQNWLEPIRASSLDASDEGKTTLTLEVPNSFSAQYLRSRFNRELTRAVHQSVGETTDVVFEVNTSLEKEISGDGAADSSAPAPDTSPDTGSASPSSGRSARRPQSRGTDRPNPDPSEETTPSGRPASTEGSTGPPASSSPNSSSSQPSEARRSSPSSSGSQQRGRETGARSSSPSSSANRRPTGESRPSADGRSSRGSSPSRGTGRSGTRPQSNEASAQSSHANAKSTGADLKSEYTFGEFIEGDGNRLARSAALAVAQNPGDTHYNPLLVYGGVGLGKTHLAQAIANYALSNATADRVLYVSSDRFTSQFVQSVRDNQIASFSRYYRQADLLIVDDVQFFSGKEKTQEEFFHIFNELHQHGKQIVLCADRPPREIEGIEERLLSRFQWGLSADIQRPDLETRLAILQRKAAHQELEVDPKVLELLAHRIDSNIRQLEGALNRLTALAQLGDQTLDLDTARSFLRDQVGDGDETATNASDIIDRVADFYNLSTDDLLSRSRKQEIAKARQVAMYLCRELTDQSYASIGTRFGGRDHSTVIHAYKKIEDRMDVEPDVRDEVQSIRKRVGGSSFGGFGG